MKRPGVSDFLALAFISVAAFQNCGEFAPSIPGGRSLSSASSGNSRLWSVTPTLVKNQSIEVRADLSTYPASTDFYWDHEFGDGSTYCDQTTSPDRSTVTFLCSAEGRLRVLFIAQAENGDEESESITLYVNGTGGPGPTPTPPPDAGGAPLYTQYCSGCHGALAVSTKRGRTLAQLNGSIGNAGISDMNTMTLRNLSTTDRQAIITALQ